MQRSGKAVASPAATTWKFMREAEPQERLQVSRRSYPDFEAGRIESDAGCSWKRDRRVLTACAGRAESALLLTCGRPMQSVCWANRMAEHREHRIRRTIPLLRISRPWWPSKAELFDSVRKQHGYIVASAGINPAVLSANTQVDGGRKEVVFALLPPLGLRTR